MTMNKVAILFSILLGLTACNGISGDGRQSKKICINASQYELDFGVVPDTVSSLWEQLAIYNESSDTVKITHIDKSCGCTKLELSNTVILPNDSVLFSINVDLGTNYSFFEREVSLYTSQKEEPLTIYVRASRLYPAQVAAREFPFIVSENLRLNTPYLIIGYANLGEVKTAHINILNQSDNDVTYDVRIPDKPSYVSLYQDDIIKAGEVGRITFLIDLSQIDNIWGLQRYNIIVQDRNSGEEATIPVEVIFAEKTNRLDKDAPRIMVPVTHYTINSSTQQKVEFILRNIGKKVLYIRDIQKEGTETIVLETNEVKSGTETKLTVRIKPKQTNPIEIGITTNDPTEPYKILRIDCNP